MHAIVQYYLSELSQYFSLNLIIGNEIFKLKYFAELIVKDCFNKF